MKQALKQNRIKYLPRTLITFLTLTVISSCGKNEATTSELNAGKLRKTMIGEKLSQILLQNFFVAAPVVSKHLLEIQPDYPRRYLPDYRNQSNIGYKEVWFPIKNAPIPNGIVSNQEPSHIECSNRPVAALNRGEHGRATCIVMDFGETGQTSNIIEINNRITAKIIFESIPEKPTTIQSGWPSRVRKSYGNIACELNHGYSENYRCAIRN